MTCGYCGNKIEPPKRKYCSNSHKQMAFAKRRPDYYASQKTKARRRKNKGVRLTANINFIEGALILWDEDISHI